eukprot:GHVL01008213.1.p1 GENE.GHVL01008213.1~~GHVL01008213.1.p1  ORF type:complete len:378 (+),score=85.65 GHVL01008213.1:82-1215(+)
MDESFPNGVAPVEYYNVDVHRLAKLKQQQQEALKLINNRINRIQATEDKVWHDIDAAKTKAAKIAEARERIAQRHAERLEKVKAIQEEKEFLKSQKKAEKDYSVARVQQSVQDAQYDKQKVGCAIREKLRACRVEKEMLEQDRAQQTAMMISQQRQSVEINRINKQLESEQKEQSRKAMNALRYTEIEEEVRRLQEELVQAEAAELESIQRLQNSRLLHDSEIANMSLSGKNSFNLSGGQLDISSSSKGNKSFHATPKRNLQSQASLNRGRVTGGAGPPRVVSKYRQNNPTGSRTRSSSATSRRDTSRSSSQQPGRRNATHTTSTANVMSSGNSSVFSNKSSRVNNRQMSHNSSSSTLTPVHTAAAHLDSNCTNVSG